VLEQSVRAFAYDSIYEITLRNIGRGLW